MENNNKKLRSSGKVKESRSGKNCSRRAGKGPLLRVSENEQVRNEASRRWTNKEQDQAYFELNRTELGKAQRGGRAGKKPPTFFFPLLEQAMGADNESWKLDTIRELFKCASLKLKPVKRYPGYILERTYNLKGKVLNFS